LQIDRLKRELQLISQNIQNLQNKLDDIKMKSFIEKDITFEKFKKCFGDIQNLKNANKNLLQIFRNTEFERDTINKIRQEIVRKYEIFKKKLEKIKQNYRKMVIYK
jgi:hypothetical protein